MANEVTIHVKSEDRTDMDLIGRKVEAKAKASFLKTGSHSGAAFAAGFIKTITFGLVGSGFAQAATRLQPQMAHIGGVLGAGLAAGMVMRVSSYLAAALPLALGGSALAGPLIYLWKTQEKAVAQLTKHAKSFMKEISRPVKAPFLESLKIVGKQLDTWAPKVKAFMKQLAPTLPGFTKGALQAIENFVREVFGKNGKSITQGMKTWSEELPKIGTALGKMVSAILKDPKATHKAIQQMSTDLQNLAGAAGDTIHTLSKAQAAYNRFAKFIDKQENSNLGGDNFLLPKPATVQKTVNGIVRAFHRLASGTGNAMDNLKGHLSEARGGISRFASAAVSRIRSMASTVVSRVRSMASSAVSAFNRLRSGAVSSFHSMGSNIVSAARRIGSQVVAAFRNFVNRAVAVVRGGVGRMAAAGAALVRGLASGIRGAIGAVTGAIGSVISRAISFGKSLIPGHAYGGITSHAAEGGPRDGLTLVGERGPELVQLPGGSHVFPNGNTTGMSKGGRGGGDVHVHVHGSMLGTPTELIRLLVNAKRSGQLDVLFR